MCKAILLKESLSLICAEPFHKYNKNYIMALLYFAELTVILGILYLKSRFNSHKIIHEWPDGQLFVQKI